MSSRHLRSVLVPAVIFSILAASWHPGAESTARSAAERDPSRGRTARALLGSLPLYFVENRGQADARIAYYVQGRGASVAFGQQGVTFALREPGSVERESVERGAHPRPARSTLSPSHASRRQWVVKLDYLGANPRPEIVASDRAPAVVSYFKGPRAAWKTGLPTYTTLTYRDLWPGIDLVYSGSANQLKYAFVVRPGADPSQIRLAYRGAREVRLGADGQLEIATPVGGFVDDRPRAFQEVGGHQVDVPVAFSLGGDQDEETRPVAFQVGAYDPSLTLVLDPATLIYAGYIGGDGRDEGFGVAVDGLGYAYVAGWTNSTEPTFPETVGPSTTYTGQDDAFVAKVSADGSSLVYAGYLGGESYDYAYAIAVDGSGNAYVTGETGSYEDTFPVVGGPGTTFLEGDSDAFVAKVKADGTELLYAGYIGGAGYDAGYGIAVDGSGNAYVTGTTSSSATTFPERVGPDLSLGGPSDAFVAKVNPSGSGLVYAGYLGGSGDESGYGIAVDGAGNAYVAGETSSSHSSFPETIGPDLTFNGAVDGFVARVNASGSGLAYAGFLGGSSDDLASAIALEPGCAANCAAYVTGWTSSTQASFPDVGGPDLAYNGGASDAFVAKVRGDGSGLEFAGYLGGSGLDRGYGIAVDASGNAYVTGRTDSTQSSFPVLAGPDTSYNGGASDAFVAKLRSDGSGLVYAGYIGSGGTDRAYAIAVDSAGNAYVTGYAEAAIPAVGGPDLSFGGDADAFVARIEALAEPEPTATPTATATPDGTATPTPTATATRTPTPNPNAIRTKSHVLSTEVLKNKRTVHSTVQVQDANGGAVVKARVTVELRRDGVPVATRTSNKQFQVPGQYRLTFNKKLLAGTYSAVVTNVVLKGKTFVKSLPKPDTADEIVVP